MRLTGFAAVVILLCLPASLLAEDDPKVEVFGGYSYLLADTTFDSINLHGWNASVAGNITSWLGVVGDFSGHYGSPSVFGFDIPFLDVRAHSFLVGPKLAYRGSDTVTPFAHFLVGVTRVDAFRFSDQAFAGVIGGGLDIRLSDTLAIRAFQADYLTTKFGEDVWNDARQHNFRLSAGIVLRF